MEKTVQRLLVLAIVAVILWIPVAYLAIGVLTEPYGVFGAYLLAIVIAAVLIVRKRPANS
jgi:hypothetical protein